MDARGVGGGMGGGGGGWLTDRQIAILPTRCEQPPIRTKMHMRHSTAVVFVGGDAGFPPHIPDFHTGV